MAQLDSNYRQVIKQLGKVDKEAKKEIRTALRADLAPIVAQARANAGWSTRIPAAIVPKVSARDVAVRVNSKKAPHGKVYEFGGRHPVFGNRAVWVPVAAKPYVRPAVNANRTKVRLSMGVAIAKANKKAGF